MEQIASKTGGFVMRIVTWGSVPSPWYVFYEFARQSYLGFAIAFGPPVVRTRKGVGSRRPEGPYEKIPAPPHSQQIPDIGSGAAGHEALAIEAKSLTYFSTTERPHEIFR
jgi:hypothetical protein